MKAIIGSLCAAGALAVCVVALAGTAKKAGAKAKPAPAAEKGPLGSSSAGAPMRPMMRTLTCVASGATLYGGLGEAEQLNCPAGCARGKVFGTGIYSDDSHVCAAAIHAGVVPPGGGMFTAFIAPGQETYLGSKRHGVTSRKKGAASRSFVIGKATERWGLRPPGGCEQDATSLAGGPGSRHSITCPAGCTGGAVWGTTTYTADSAICTAAIHAGFLAPDVGGTVKIVLKKGMPGYTGTTRNGISSSRWDAYGSSYSFVR